ncbi:MAG: hypothetical protein ABJ327_16090 [Litoreibacter sp.]
MIKSVSNLRARSRWFGAAQAIVIFVLASAGVARADVWDEFETRCLATMEAVTPTDLTGLSRSEPQDGFDVWMGQEGWKLRLSLSDEDGNVCILEGFDWSGDVSEAASGWATRALAAGKYEPLPEENSQYVSVYRSTNWREPRIEVRVQSSDGELVPQLIVQETDLES